jgi:uncharacterized protein YxjI
VATEPRADIAGVLDVVANADRFLIQQVFKPIANEYRISVPPPGSTEEGPPLLFVKQKRLSIREDIRFRLDPDADEHLFMIRAKTVFEFRGRHDVLDAEGAQIGLLEKDFARSLVRSHWHVREPAGAELFEGYEASWPIAIVRRVAGFLPEFLAVFEWLPFNFTLIREGAQVGSYKRVLGKFRDRYVLELGSELEGVDRRLVLAFAVGLDALQDR